ncbi:ParA family protein [Desulfobulbus rhabdoformis]|uniref:ParA family protein n=1 Tax=Desulfobulbus rhabdoformis TaxID=34032 RepID=UPI00196603F0|nr:ParA family protein [Desulfobulbus rhabdoformis]MBM9614716.1 ParA family protein [Desulfobulbus rhabdoformis]
MARKDGPITVCVINLKGGVGKSTIATLLCREALINRKKDVLAIDLDPQANLSQALMHYSYNQFLSEQWPSVVELFNGYQPPSASTGGPTGLTNNSVVQTITTIGDNTLQIIPSRFDFSDNLIDSARPDPRVLARFLAKNFKKKDLIIIDCAPTESILTRAAYHASRLVLIPVKPEYFATIGFPLLQESLTSFRKQNRGHRIDVSGIVINNAFYDGGNNGGPEKKRALGDIESEALINGWRIFNNEIPFSRGFPKITRGDHSYTGNAVMFRYFANEFFDQIGL